jgi:Pin2-interacting protein X1
LTTTTESTFNIVKMGLAEPRKQALPFLTRNIHKLTASRRLKISHDPNNTAWSTSTSSYGQRLMISQGWVAGQGLGAQNRKDFNSYDSAKVKVSFKDDNLGLGASLKSKDIEHSRTGLDAFQGLLGRLNGKSDAELEKAEKKVEDRKLAMFAQGKWGGMIFVPGGLLVQRDDFKAQDEKPKEKTAKPRNDAEAIARMKRKQKGGEDEDTMSAEEDKASARRKQERAEKRQRKKERRRRKAKKAAASEGATPTEVSEVDVSEKKEKKRSKSLPASPKDTSASASNTDTEDVPVTTQPRPPIRNGRQMLRGKNIAAKKMAFADAKMLDEIFMRTA